MEELRVPMAAPLSALTEDPLTDLQWRTLLSIADAVIPSIRPKSERPSSNVLAVSDDVYADSLADIIGTVPSTMAKKEDVLQYLQEEASSIPAFKDQIARLICFHMPPSQRKEIIMVLNLLKYVVCAV